MLAGLILAGGKSSRMGTDKSLLCLPDSQQSLLEHHQKQLSLVCEQNIFISGSQHAQGIADIFPNSGPLSGIHAAISHILLHHSKISELLVIAVDMPDLCSDDYNHLLKMGRENNCLCSFVNCFLPLYMPISCELTKYLAKVFDHPPDEALIQSKQQKYSMKMMLDSLKSLQVQPFKNTQLNNINTAVQWQKRCAEQPYNEA